MKDRPLAAFGGRKFSLTVALLLGAAVCIAMDIKPDKDMLEFIKWIAGLYFAGNVGKGFVDRTKAAKEEISGPETVVRVEKLVREAA